MHKHLETGSTISPSESVGHEMQINVSQSVFGTGAKFFQFIFRLSHFTEIKRDFYEATEANTISLTFKYSQTCVKQAPMGKPKLVA